MSKWFHIVNGKGRDWKFITDPTRTLFYLDDILVGQLFKDKRTGWGGFGQFAGAPLVYGFKTRHACAAYILQFEDENLKKVFK